MESTATRSFATTSASSTTSRARAQCALAPDPARQVRPARLDERTRVRRRQPHAPRRPPPAHAVIGEAASGARIALDPRSEGPMIPSVVQRVTSPVFIGREGEVDQLGEVIGRASAGIPSTVLIGGEAGIGKSRLLGELAARARARDLLVLEGACVGFGGDEALPFAPIAAALRALVRELDRGTLDKPPRRVDRRARPPRPGARRNAGRGALLSSRPNWAQTRLFDGLLTLLGRLGGARRTCSSSRTSTGPTARPGTCSRSSLGTPATSGVAFVATYRTDELHRRHPLRPWLAEMDRLAYVRRLELRRFDREELRGQLEAILGAPPALELLECVARRSGRQPVLRRGARRVLRRLAGRPAAGRPPRRPARAGRLAVRRGPGRSSASPRSRARGRPRPARRGRGGRRDRVTVAIREAVEAQIVVPSDIDGRPAYAFRHALVQEAVYDDVLPRERRACHAAYVARARGAAGPRRGRGREPPLVARAPRRCRPRRAGRSAAWTEAARAAPGPPRSRSPRRRTSARSTCGTPSPRPTGRRTWTSSSCIYEASMALIQAGDIGRAATSPGGRGPFNAAEDPLRAALLRERLGRALWLAGTCRARSGSWMRPSRSWTGRSPRPTCARVIAGLAGP